MAERIQFEEECGCGAKLKVIGPDSSVDPMYYSLALWRTEHACNRRAHKALASTLGSWRERYVGQECRACTQVLTTPDGLTTVDSFPVHLMCRKCVLCRRTKPHAMRWSDQYGLPEGDPEGLVHPTCARNRINQHKTESDHGDDEPGRHHEAGRQGVDAPGLEAGRPPELQQPEL